MTPYSAIYVSDKAKAFRRREQVRDLRRRGVIFTYEWNGCQQRSSDIFREWLEGTTTLLFGGSERGSARRPAQLACSTRKDSPLALGRELQFRPSAWIQPRWFH